MSSTTKTREPINGVNVPAFFATLNAVKDQPELAKFQWRATNAWKLGTHSQTRLQSFSGAGGEQQHEREYVLDADHPKCLVGDDQGPTPVEYILHGLAACLTAGIGNIASARGVKLTSVEATLEGDMDLRGILGLSDEVRNGFSGIRVRFKIEGDAPAETLRQIVEQSRKRSAVFDVLTGRTPVEITVDA